MKKPLLAAAALLLLAAAAPAQNRNRFFDLVAAYVIGDNLGKTAGSAIDSAAAMGEHAREASLDIAQKRQRFFAATPATPEYEQARVEFSQALAGKDIYYLLLSMADGPQATFMKFAAGDIDGGIPESAEGEFDEWIQIFRDHARGNGQLDNLFQIPGRIAYGLERSQEPYEAYRFARDWAEVQRSGRPVPPLSYAAGLVRRFPHPKPAAAAQREWAALSELFGEARLEQAAAAIQKAGLQPSGTVANPAALGFVQKAELDPSRRDYPAVPDGYVALRNPYQPYMVFYSLLGRAAPDAYFLTQLYDWSSDDGWAGAANKLYLFCVAFGQDAVNKAAERVQTAPKSMQEGFLVDARSLGITNRRPVLAIEELLAVNDPSGYARLLLGRKLGASSPEQIQNAYAQLVGQYGEQHVAAAARAAAQARNNNIEAFFAALQGRQPPSGLRKGGLTK